MNLDRIRSNTRQSPPLSPPPDPSSSVSPPCRRPSSATDRARRRSRRRDGTTVYVQRRVTTQCRSSECVGASILVTRDRARSFYSRYPADGSRSLREAVGERAVLSVSLLARLLARLLACLPVPACPHTRPPPDCLPTCLPVRLSTLPIFLSNLAIPSIPTFFDARKRAALKDWQNRRRPLPVIPWQVVSDLART